MLMTEKREKYCKKHFPFFGLTTNPLSSLTEEQQLFERILTSNG